MPYFVFKYQDEIIRQVELIDSFESFKEAKSLARNLREENSPDNPDAYKVIFASDKLEAEMLLLEKREAPILREWEK
ncbi:MAG: hypothetical protein CMD90_00105 [Gammaproteobacteria bacterium]|nr:hypothetical protein [Gammaproteobacteria bacterium]|tara:strand:- start:820 stop:1050 length:231 start_codon:yes stop_codon:yes gene_type:complete